MARKISRRDFGIQAALGLSALAIPSTVIAQAAPPAETPPEVSDDALTAIQGQLAKPLSDEVKKLLKDAVVNSRIASRDRKKTKLPENSEPCFATLTHTATRRQP